MHAGEAAGEMIVRRRWGFIAFGAVILGVLAMFLTPILGPASKQGLTNPAFVESQLLADPVGGALNRTIARTFPEEFEALKQAIVQRAKAGDGPGAAQDAAGAFVYEATRRHRSALPQAPPASLRRYLKAEIALVEQLADAPDRCAAYFADPMDDAGWFAPDLRERYLALNIALWEAAAAARDKPAGRSVAPAAKPVSCAEGLDALKAAAALPDARFEQVYPAML